MKFTKMHGLGNDFIILDYLERSLPENYDWGKLSEKVCKRGFGVGADGLVLISRDDNQTYSMRIFNSDGSEAEMCGNAVRCIGKYLYEAKGIKKDTLVITTKGGSKKLKIIKNDDIVKEVEVNMGRPILDSKDIPMSGASRNVIGEKVETPYGSFEITAVSMGNPHAVIFCDDFDDELINNLGPYIEKHDLFPNGTNVEFVKVHNQEEITVKVWERGAGRTYACGTGACGALAASALNGYTGNSAKVNLPGGSLNIKWAKDESGDIYMSGKAEFVYTGNLRPEFW
ncbi:diaminopimelate epimerase [Natranaerofaba carboxydovora]|uniref:diaminopimelate epimerase n=1 Tax=Natranaerofaba carboxydovora TaxID=2742683 RepID=UPI001F13B429|nr:diaminopimelate epimerase [Natranaerofaba carboxydovora]UMZ73218.1 Diaminopimelate epimerase [Natranaerofaba carboxydovora]